MNIELDIYVNELIDVQNNLNLDDLDNDNMAYLLKNCINLSNSLMAKLYENNCTIRLQVIDMQPMLRFDSLPNINVMVGKII